MNRKLIIFGALIVLTGSFFLFSGDDDFVCPLESYAEGALSAAEYKDKIVVANVWATWCPFCINELPDFAKLQEAFPDKVVVIAINRGESCKKAHNYITKNGLTDKMTFVQDEEDTFNASI